MHLAISGICLEKSGGGLARLDNVIPIQAAIEMAITNIKVKDMPNPFYFPESKLAHKYLDGLTGLEIGSSSHNSHGLAGSLNVAPSDDEVFRQAEIDLCGFYAQVDIVAEGDDIPVDDESQDYVISSHVLEHMPSLFNAFLEWNRIVKPGGYIYIVVPKRSEDPGDKGRPITSLFQALRSWREHWTVDTIPPDIVKASGGQRGHIWVFTLESLLEVIETMNLLLPAYFNWEIVEALESDDKVSNGHVVVARKREAPRPYINPRGAPLSSAINNFEITNTQPHLTSLGVDTPRLPFEFASALPRIEVGGDPDPVEDNLVRRLHERG